MKRLFFVSCLYVALSGLSVGELITVNANNPNPVWTSMVLLSGHEYLIEVQGTFTYTSDKMPADAEWAFRRSDQIWMEYLSPSPDPSIILDLFVDGESLDWLGTNDGVNFSAHTYSPNHNYRTYFTGMGEAISLLIYDTQYDDNIGQLTVEIVEIPEPCTLLLFGLGGFVLRGKHRRS